MSFMIRVRVSMTVILQRTVIYEWPNAEVNHLSKSEKGRIRLMEIKTRETILNLKYLERLPAALRLFRASVRFCNRTK